MNSAVFLASNIHCPSCVSHIQDTLSHLPGIASADEVSLINQTIRVVFDGEKLDYNAIADKLASAAFELEHVAVFDSHGGTIVERDLGGSIQDNAMGSRPQKSHVDHCDACRTKWTEDEELSEHSSRPPIVMPSADDKPAIIQVDDASETDSTITYSASLLIEGMSCGSCVGKITAELNALPFVVEANIDLLTNSGTVLFHGKGNLDKVLERISDLGYEATAAETHESGPKPDSLYTASLSIEGMSCGSCSGKIKAALERLAFVSAINVDLLNNSALVEFHGEDGNLKQILDAIQNAGYSANAVDVSERKSALVTKERTVELQIDGMHCPHCPERVTKALEVLRSEGYAGRLRISRPPTSKLPRVELKYEPSLADGLTIRDLISAIKSVDPAFSVKVYHAPTIEERSKRIQQRERRSLLWRLLFTGIVAIPSLIIGVVYMALVPSDNPTRMWFEEPMWAGNATRTEWALLIMTTPVMFFGTDIFHRRAFREIWAMWRPQSTVPILRRFYRFGSMNMLISVGTLVAYCSSLAVLIMNAAEKGHREHGMSMSSSYFDVITFLTFFILMGRYLEAYSKAKTGDAVASLSKLRPSEALLVEEDGVTMPAPVDQLEVGDVVRIPRGHSPPADGIIEQSGSFSFDESSLTGESKPVRKSIGDLVLTGTVNVADPVDIRVTGLGSVSMLDQIIEVVRSGQAKRAPIERIADVLTGYFVPIVTLLAITTWVTWLGLGLSGRLPHAWLDSTKGGWTFWSLEFAIAVFVVACPCGIGLAAPTALFVGGGLAAKQGILVQGGGQAFQETSSLDTIVFDKTGTLTQGQMTVTGFEQVDDTFTKDQIFAMAQVMENASSHPIARAIGAFCASTRERAVVSELREVPGRGMTAKLVLKSDSDSSPIDVAIGSGKHLDLLRDVEVAGKPEISYSEAGRKIERESTQRLQQALHRHQIQGHTVSVIAVRRNGRFEAVGIFALSDPLRSEAVEVVASLRREGLAIHLCTGDNATTARAIAAQLGIPTANVRAGVLPQGKADYIHELQHGDKGSRKLVAFAGDGVNDTPALTAADVSISLSSGSDIAMNASSFILLKSHLGGIHSLYALSKRVFLRVKLNFFWAGIYNITLIPVAAGVFYTIGASEHEGGWRMSPVWAAVAMAGSSASVVLSSLALRLPELRWRSSSRTST